jgi:hypothetical protein
LFVCLIQRPQKPITFASTVVSSQQHSPNQNTTPNNEFLKSSKVMLNTDERYYDLKLKYLKQNQIELKNNLDNLNNFVQTSTGVVTPCQAQKQHTSLNSSSNNNSNCPTSGSSSLSSSSEEIRRKSADLVVVDVALNTNSNTSSNNNNNKLKPEEECNQIVVTTEEIHLIPDNTKKDDNAQAELKNGDVVIIANKTEVDKPHEISNILVDQKQSSSPLPQESLESSTKPNDEQTTTTTTTTNLPQVHRVIFDFSLLLLT